MSSKRKNNKILNQSRPMETTLSLDKLMSNIAFKHVIDSLKPLLTDSLLHYALEFPKRPEIISKILP